MTVPTAEVIFESLERLIEKHNELGNIIKVHLGHFLLAFVLLGNFFVYADHSHWLRPLTALSEIMKVSQVLLL